MIIKTETPVCDGNHIFGLTLELLVSPLQYRQRGVTDALATTQSYRWSDRQARHAVQVQAISQPLTPVRATACAQPSLRKKCRL